MFSINFHDALHLFYAGSGTGTATLEAKLLHQIIAMMKRVFVSIFIDIHTVYDSLDREQCLDILEGYGVGTRTLHIMWTYWVRIQMAEKAGDH